MTSLLEKAIVALLNNEQGKAEALFHKFMVERAREIHESLRQNEDVELSEGWDTEIQEEEYFDDLDKPEEEEGGDLAGVEDVPADGMGDEAAMGGDDTGEMGDIEGADDLDGMGDEEGMPGEGGEESLEAKLDHIEAQMDELSAQFDELMSKYDGDEGDLGDDLGDETDGLDGLGDETEDLGGDEASDMGGDESEDLADRMDTDLGDEGPEHEMAEEAEPPMEGEDMEEMEEDDSMLSDITESVLAELDRVAAVSNSEGKEVGSGGKTMTPHDGSFLPNHGVKDRVDQAKPVLVKAEGDAHNDSMERETPPSNKKVTARRNNDAGVKKLSKVPAKGDASAMLNHDFTEIKPTKLPIDGSKKVR